MSYLLSSPALPKRRSNELFTASLAPSPPIATALTFVVLHLLELCRSTASSNVELWSWSRTTQLWRWNSGEWCFPLRPAPRQTELATYPRSQSSPDEAANLRQDRTRGRKSRRSLWLVLGVVIFLIVAAVIAVRFSAPRGNSARAMLTRTFLPGSSV